MNWKMNQHCVINKKLNHIAGKSLAVARANHIRQKVCIFYCYSEKFNNMQNCKTNINNDLGRTKEEKHAPIKPLHASAERVDKVVRIEK
jgi:hypothetical protein